MSKEDKERIKAVAFTDSVHSVSFRESTSIKRFFKERTRNWVSSYEELDAPVRGYYGDDCQQVSAGTTERVWTSHYAKDSAFKFFKEKLEKYSGKEGDDLCDINPTKLHVISPQYRPNKLDVVYKMTSNPRGLAVIVNMKTFQATNLKDREGSEFDVRGLCGLFTGLDFGITELPDRLTKDQLLSEFRKISEIDFTMYDCLVVCIMSHGNIDYFYAYDGGTIKVQEIKEMFNNRNCESLCGKPKLFFINACRGRPADRGTRVVKEGPESEVPPEPNNSSDVEACESLTTGEHADILTAFSSVDGYCSFRNKDEGTWFIMKLIEVFREYAGVEDVESMLTRVRKSVNTLGNLGSKQVPKHDSTLTKKVFLWPGMKFDD